MSSWIESASEAQSACSELNIDLTAKEETLFSELLISIFSLISQISRQENRNEADIFADLFLNEAQGRTDLVC